MKISFDSEQTSRDVCATMKWFHERHFFWREQTLFELINCVIEQFRNLGICIPPFLHFHFVAALSIGFHSLQATFSLELTLLWHLFVNTFHLEYVLHLRLLVVLKTMTKLFWHDDRFQSWRFDNKPFGWVVRLAQLGHPPSFDCNHWTSSIGREVQRLALRPKRF